MAVGVRSDAALSGFVAVSSGIPCRNSMWLKHSQIPKRKK
jgi:hypothetical protein